jgi:hypothetical protein
MVGQAIGAALALAVVVFVVARKLCGPPGARHLARLNRIAGEDVPEDRLSLYVRDWLPYVAAGLAALTGGLFSLVNAGVPLHPSSDETILQLTSGFKSGCQRSCTAQRDAAFCEGLCDCTFAKLRADHPGNDALASWMQAGTQNVDAVRAEVQSAQAACMGASDPSQLADPQPAAVAPRQHAEAAVQPSLDKPPETQAPPSLDGPQYEPAVMKRIHEEFEPFLKWAAAAKLAPETIAGAEVCAAATDPSAGICTKSVAAPIFGDQIFSASYKPGAPAALRLAVTVQLLVGCRDLAPSHTLAAWRRGESEKELCEIANGPLGGLRLLAVRSRLSTSLFLFTPAYPAQDPAFRAAATPGK